MSPTTAKKPQKRGATKKGAASPTPKVLLDLLEAQGPSGYETAPAAVWRDAAQGFAAVSTDVVGTPLALVAPKHDARTPARRLLGVRAVLAESFERIHRSNLVGMGVLPLQFPDGQSADSLGLTGEEVFSIEGLAAAMNDGDPVAPLPSEVQVQAQRDGAEPVSFAARVRIDTPREAEYFRHGGILQFVLRQLLIAE